MNSEEQASLNHYNACEAIAVSKRENQRLQRHNTELRAENSRLRTALAQIRSIGLDALWLPEVEK